MWVERYIWCKWSVCVVLWSHQFRTAHFGAWAYTCSCAGTCSGEREGTDRHREISSSLSTNKSCISTSPLSFCHSPEAWAMPLPHAIKDWHIYSTPQPLSYSQVVPTHKIWNRVKAKLKIMTDCHYVSTKRRIWKMSHLQLEM